MRRTLITAALCSATCVVPASGQAAVTIGAPDLGAAPDDVVTCTFPECPSAVVQDTIGSEDVTAPHGVITRVRLKASGTVTFTVYRPSQRDGSGLTASPTYGVDIFGDGPSTATVRDVRMPVGAGDMIGIEIPHQSGIWGVQPDDGSWSWDAIPDGEFGDIDTTQGYDGWVWLYNATVEPDADGDGYGDETQDGCPSNGSTQGACPAPAGGGDAGGGGGTGGGGGPSALKRPALASRVVNATRSGGFALRLNNPNPYRVSGKATVKSGRKVVGSKTYALAANGGTTLRFKLPKALARKLKRRRKLALALSATARGPRGTRPKQLRTKVTVRRSGGRRPAPGGGGGGSLDGKYAKPPGESGASITFQVTDRGTRIRELGGTLVGTCFNVVTGIEIRVLSPYIPEMTVAPDGSFSGVYESDGARSEVTNGRLSRDGTATGEVSVKFSGCSGKASFTSKRQSG